VTLSLEEYEAQKAAKRAEMDHELFRARQEAAVDSAEFEGLTLKAAAADADGQLLSTSKDKKAKAKKSGRAKQVLTDVG
ncbi:unnamed protein product, partial [Heterosigma akashiwo]